MKRWMIPCIVGSTLWINSCNDSYDKQESLLSTQVQDLTLKQAREICEQYRSDIDFAGDPSVQCTQPALHIASTKEECEHIRMDCIESYSTTQGPDCSKLQEQDLQGCTQTAQEVLDCLKELAAYYQNISCDDFGDDSVLDDLPPCMDRVQKTCPGMFGGDEENEVIESETRVEFHVAGSSGGYDN